MKSLIWRQLLLTSLIVPAIIAPTFAQQSDRVYVAFDDEALAVSTAAVGFTQATIEPSGSAYRAELASFRVECASTSPCPVRLRYTGSAATSALGYELDDGDSRTLKGWDNIDNASWIRSGSNDAVIDVIFHR
jgi:hypothetical protein